MAEILNSLCCIVIQQKQLVLPLTVISKLSDYTNYRATLCVSAVFVVVRCLSVRLSRWCIVCTRLNISSNFFLSLVAPSF